MGKYFGIDLGTTYSCIASLHNNKSVKIHRNSEGEETTPSVIDLKPDGTCSVGSTAKDDVLSSGFLIEEIKREMGNPNYRIEVNGNVYTPVTLSSLILKKLKDDVESTGEEIDGVTITCPAYFGHIERQNTKAAGRAAGLNVLSIINEPTAAAYSYVCERMEIGESKIILVYDLGGGTFDVTLLKAYVEESENGSPRQILQVIASEGNPRLGGKDWDKCIYNRLIQQASDELECSTESLDNDPAIRKQLIRDSEKIKKMLSKKTAQRTNIITPFGNCTAEITLEDFEKDTAYLLDSTIALTENVLCALNDMNEKLDEIVLVGGSTFMPQVRKALTSNEKIKKAMKNGTVVIKSNDPTNDVAHGAALWANVMGTKSERKSRGRVISEEKEWAKNGKTAATEDVSETEIVSTESFNCTYGVIVRDTSNNKDFVSNLLLIGTEYDPSTGYRNKKIYYPVQNGQALISIRIVENKSKAQTCEVSESKEIFNFDFPLPRDIKTTDEIAIEFFYDPSAILHINVSESKTNTSMNDKQIKTNGVLGEDEILKASELVSKTKIID